MGIHLWTGPIWEEQPQAAMLDGGLVMCEEFTSSSTFADSQVSTSAETLVLERIQILSFSTVFIDYFWDWLKGTDGE